MVHINHLLVLAQPDFVGREVGTTFTERAARGPAAALRRLLARR